MDSIMVSKTEQDRSDAIALFHVQHSQWERRGEESRLKDASFIHLLNIDGHPSF